MATRENFRTERRRRGQKRRLRRGALARPGPETAPTLGERAKKIPTDEGWDFGYWWRNKELNPRPFPDADGNALVLRPWILRFGQVHKNVRIAEDGRSPCGPRDQDRGIRSGVDRQVVWMRTKKSQKPQSGSMPTSSGTHCRACLEDALTAAFSTFPLRKTA